MKFTADFFELLFLASIGISIHIVTKIIENRKSGKDNDWVAHALTTILSFLISFTIIYTKDSIKEILPITGFIATMVGYSAQSIFTKIVSIKMPQNN